LELDAWSENLFILFQISCYLQYWSQIDIFFFVL
jgi:hypothetical protein